MDDDFHIPSEKETIKTSRKKNTKPIMLSCSGNVINRPKKKKKIFIFYDLFEKYVTT